MRNAFTKTGGNLGTSGSVAYLFNKRGRIGFNADVREEDVMEAALEGGAEDLVTNADGSLDIFTDPADFGAVKDALEAAGFEPASAEVSMLPDTSAEITDVELAQKVLKLVDMLEDLDDVQEVYSNADFSDAVMEQLG